MFEGTLKKMITEFASPIHYFLDMNDGFIHLNQCIGKLVFLEWRVIVNLMGKELQ